MNIRNLSADVLERARRVKLLLMDCDGVLTDGRLYFTSNGEEMKVFNVRDGQGLASWHRAGYRSGIITGRDGEKILRARAAELNISHLKVRSRDKAKDFAEIIEAEAVKPEDVAYIGDDIGDICLMKLVGFPVAVADAAGEVFPYVIHTTEKKGGRGAVRELTDLLLAAKK
ncbi:MAG: HAD hydrolase family protein [Acidobacteria bacterium]|nr:HAD hydrolase family protein [Acidobacteriota bacterium]